MSAEAPLFSGIDGSTGRPLLPPLSLEALAGIAAGGRLGGDPRRDLHWWAHRHREEDLEVKHGVDPTDLAQAGWGVLFPAGADPAVREALAPLLEHRRRQAGALYRELNGERGYRPGDSKLDFLARHGVGPMAVDPRDLPYYLLLVGGPEEIPFSFQYHLDVQYAVGRVHFDHPEEYGRYARAVVAAESRKREAPAAAPRRLVCFGVRNPDDRATRSICDQLMVPLADGLSDGLAGWQVEKVLGQEATKARLQGLLGGETTPSVLFAAAHGLGFPTGDSRQRAAQGALLCREWPGPRAWHGAIPPAHYLAAADLADDARPDGLIAFFFACYGAGTPCMDDFSHRSDEPRQIAPSPFVARLPQRLLAPSADGALAVIGHVERAWTFSFLWPNVGAQIQDFESTLAMVAEGYPVGRAMEHFNLRYAVLATELAALQGQIQAGRKVDPRHLLGLWTAHNDARNYVVLGDPAVRVPGAGPPASRSRARR